MIRWASPPDSVGDGLPEMNVVEADVVQRLQHAANLRNVLEQFDGLLNVHGQHVVNALAAIANLQRLAIETLAFAHRTRDPNVGQEVHFELGWRRSLRTPRSGRPDG